jgi:hypothetical protein
MTLECQRRLSTRVGLPKSSAHSAVPRCRTSFRSKCLTVPSFAVRKPRRCLALPLARQAAHPALPARHGTARHGVMLLCSHGTRHGTARRHAALLGVRLSRRQFGLAPADTKQTNAMERRGPSASLAVSGTGCKWAQWQPRRCSSLADCAAPRRPLHCAAALPLPVGRRLCACEGTFAGAKRVPGAWFLQNMYLVRQARPLASP